MIARVIQGLMIMMIHGGKLTRICWAGPPERESPGIWRSNRVRGNLDKRLMFLWKGAWAKRRRMIALYSANELKILSFQLGSEMELLRSV